MALSAPRVGCIQTSDHSLGTRPLKVPTRQNVLKDRCTAVMPWVAWTASDQLRHHHGVTSQASTGDEHPNATAYRRAAAAFRARDLAAIADLVDTDVVWHVPGQQPLAGDYRGRAELLRFLSGSPDSDSCSPKRTCSATTSTSAR